MAMVKKNLMYIVVAAAMLFEGLGLYFILPRGGSTVQAHDGGKSAAADNDYIEAELAASKLNNTSDPGVPVQVEFKVYASVNKDSEEKFKAVLEKKKFRIKEAVSTVLRKASYESLKEPSLTTVKRQIKEAVADVVGRDKDYVEAIIIPEFKTMEL
jgi:flagellar basal body-associated protein FliL